MPYIVGSFQIPTLIHFILTVPFPACNHSGCQQSSRPGLQCNPSVQPRTGEPSSSSSLCQSTWYREAGGLYLRLPSQFRDRRHCLSLKGNYVWDDVSNALLEVAHFE